MPVPIRTPIAVTVPQPKRRAIARTWWRSSSPRSDGRTAAARNRAALQVGQRRLLGGPRSGIPHRGVTFAAVASSGLTAALRRGGVADGSRAARRARNRAAPLALPGAFRGWAAVAGSRRGSVRRARGEPAERAGPAARRAAGRCRRLHPSGPRRASAGRKGVYAAGGATNSPIKQGGVASQQADAAAEAIAARAAADVDPQPFRPVLRGLLLTGSTPRYMRAEVSGGRGEDWRVSDHALWWPPSKIAGKRLAPYLALRHDELEQEPTGLPVDAALPGTTTSGGP
jgi:hypothetical protein